MLFGFATQAHDARATHSTSTIALLAVDTNSEGHTATSLGPVDGCSRIEAGAEAKVDYVVDAIPQDRPMIGFEAEIRYDAQILGVADADYRLLLAAAGNHQPFTGQSDQIPDSDGSFRIQVLDTASVTEPPTNVEIGPGVLARLTFRAKAAGLAAVSIAVTRDPLVYPIVLDTQNELIFADRVGGASLAIGQDCPVEAQQPVITEMAEINEQILAEDPELAGATPPGGTAAASPVTSITPEGQTPPPEESTPAPSPTTIPCAAPPRATFAASTTPAPPLPEGTTPTADTPAPTATVPVCTPTPTPIAEQIVDVDDDSRMPFIAGAAILLAGGSAAAGSGWYLYRRSRAISSA
jgi:hypothetical protein